MEIVTDTSLLRKKCSDVTKDLNIEQTIKGMVILMLKRGGSGIAAPQIGISERMFIITIKKKFEIFINPKIIFYSEEKELGRESCLSIPNCSGYVIRSKKIKITYFNGTEYVEKEYEYPLSKRIQHEYDHLDGILYIDKLIGNRNEDNIFTKVNRKCNIFAKKQLLKEVDNIKIDISKI